MKSRLVSLCLFSVAFAYVEAAVVVYLRSSLPAYPPSGVTVLLNLGFISFVQFSAPVLLSARTTVTEMFREFATMVMLVTVGLLAGKNIKSKIGAFLIAFSLWDIFYYVFLKILIGWPKTLLDPDIFFLLPVPWIGPVLTALLASTLLFLLGLVLFLQNPG